jgi:hypothetical protein
LSFALSFQSALSGIPAAILEAALVFVPRAASFRCLERLRSPFWTLVLPGSIIVGTFGLIALPWTASTTLVVAAVTTPLLALVAIASVVRGRSLIGPLAIVAGVCAVLATGLAGQLGASVITALACLTVGVTLQRLIPGRWLLVGVVAMAVTDIVLLESGAGYHQTMLLAAAANNFHGPHFTGARVGGTTIGYPDLFLAALLGAALAGSRLQRGAAVLLGVLVVAYDSLLAPGVLLPATVPIAVTLVIVSLIARARGGRAAVPALASARRGTRGDNRHRGASPLGAAGG